jgi:hypothetical protein
MDKKAFFSVSLPWYAPIDLRFMPLSCSDVMQAEVELLFLFIQALNAQQNR